MEKTKDDLSFDEIAAEVISDSKEDRASFLEIIDGMKELAKTNAEVGVIMTEQIVKGYDVLNKMNAQRAALAAMVLKSKKPSLEKDDDDLFNEIGDLAQRAGSDDRH